MGVKALSLLVAALYAAGAARAPAAEVPSRYCSPSGDYCYFVVQQRGVTWLEYRTFNPAGPRGGPYTLCISPRHHLTECHVFHVRRWHDGVYRSRVLWSAHYRGPRAGGYQARWYESGGDLGPPLTFVSRR